MKIGVAIERLADAERELADELLEAGERHKPDHDVFHVTKTLARLEEGHLEALAGHADRYDAKVKVLGDGAGPAGASTTSPTTSAIRRPRSTCGKVRRRRTRASACCRRGPG